MRLPGSAALNDAVQAGRPVLVLSAHLDDAVLSCGALLATLVERCPVTVATLFTAESTPPHTRAARSFLRQCGAADAASLFAERRAEDRAVLAALGAAYRHLDATDALFRLRRSWPLARHAGGVLPELVHRYPTYRFDIAKGRVSGGDRDLPRLLAGELASERAAVVLSPIGVGRHVDHLLTRRVGELLGGILVHYSDFPYDLIAAPDPAYLAHHGLRPWTHEHDGETKEKLIRGYRTQVEALFPSGEIPHRPETYYESTSRA